MDFLWRCNGSLALFSNDNQLLTLSRDLSDKMSHITKFTLDANNLGAEGIKTICSNNEIHFNKPLNIKFGKKNYKCQKKIHTNELDIISYALL